jgi:hypothetical protein
VGCFGENINQCSEMTCQAVLTAMIYSVPSGTEVVPFPFLPAWRSRRCSPPSRAAVIGVTISVFDSGDDCHREEVDRHESSGTLSYGAAFDDGGNWRDHLYCLRPRRDSGVGDGIFPRDTLVLHLSATADLLLGWIHSTPSLCSAVRAGFRGGYPYTSR